MLDFSLSLADWSPQGPASNPKRLCHPQYVVQSPQLTFSLLPLVTSFLPTACAKTRVPLLPRYQGPNSNSSHLKKTSFCGKSSLRTPACPVRPLFSFSPEILGLLCSIFVLRPLFFFLPELVVVGFVVGGALSYSSSLFLFASRTVLTSFYVSIGVFSSFPLRSSLRMDDLLRSREMTLTFLLDFC